MEWFSFIKYTVNPFLQDHGLKCIVQFKTLLDRVLKPENIALSLKVMLMNNAYMAKNPKFLKNRKFK